MPLQLPRLFNESRYLQVVAGNLPSDLADQLRLDGGVDLEASSELTAEDIAQHGIAFKMPTGHWAAYKDVLDFIVLTYNIEWCLQNAPAKRHNPDKVALVASLYLHCYASAGDFCTSGQTASIAAIQLTLHALNRKREVITEVIAFLDWLATKLNAEDPKHVDQGLDTIVSLCQIALHLNFLAEFTQTRMKNTGAIVATTGEQGVLFRSLLDESERCFTANGATGILEKAVRAYISATRQP